MAMANASVLAALGDLSTTSSFIKKASAVGNIGSAGRAMARLFQCYPQPVPWIIQYQA